MEITVAKALAYTSIINISQSFFFKHATWFKPARPLTT
jgi:hypothetical protein